jgi:ribonucleoside-triphosphate reductase
LTYFLKGKVLLMQRVIKRDGREVEFDKSKIIKAISCANQEVIKSKQIGPRKINQLATIVEEKCAAYKRAIKVEDINDLIEDELIYRNYNNLVRAFIQYRYNKELVRKSNTTDESILSLINLSNEELKQENANKNPVVNSTQRDYMAGEVSKDLTRRLLLPKDVVKAHDEGTIHFHDMDYFAQRLHNCDLVNLEDMLQNGTVISGTLIEKPHSFSTACNVATQIIAQVSSNQYGGQSITLSHLAPFVDISRQKIRVEVTEEQKKAAALHHGEPVPVSEQLEKLIDEITEQRVRAEVKRGVQTIQYQVNTLLTTNGQAPFITVFMYLNEVEDAQTRKDLAMIIEEVLLQRYEGVKNEKGVWITPAFPKLIYVLEEDNIREGTNYWHLTELAAKCSAKRLVPDYISEKVMKELKDGYCFPVMGCRSALSPWYDENGKAKFYGRWNKGVVTVNLPDVACSSAGENYAKDLASFWTNFDEVLDLCHKALLCRYERLKGTVSDVAPILWQHGAIARLKKGETIDKMLTGGYSTISLGYAGLWECVVELIGKDLLTEEGQALGLEIMEYMNNKCDEWNEELNLGFGIYGTPLESTTYKFAKALQKRHGEIPGVSDRNYITNSYHVHVEKPIDPFKKLSVESKFQKLSKGGAISYIETANLENNLEAVLTVIQYIYDNIMYAELNTKSDYCQECGWDREIPIVEDEHGKLIWKCPNCGNTNSDKMNIARRTCGYIGLNGFNQGRVQEISQRYVHLDCHECGC